MLQIPACHTYGRSIRQASSRIREAMLLFDELDGVEVEETISGLIQRGKLSRKLSTFNCPLHKVVEHFQSD